MTNPEVAILMLCMFIMLVLLGFPIAFTLIAMGVGFGYYAYYDGHQKYFQRYLIIIYSICSTKIHIRLWRMILLLQYPCSYLWVM